MTSSGYLEACEPIVTARLRLRCVAPADAAAIAALITPGISGQVASWPYPFTAAMATQRIEASLEAAREGRGLPMAITEHGADAMIGYVSVFRDRTEPGRAALGYWLGEAHHGRGIMSEAAPALVQAGFERLGILMIEALTQPGNASSQAVLRRCGFAPMGERISHAPARDADELCLVFTLERAAVAQTGPNQPS